MAVRCYGVRDRERTSRETGKETKVKPKRDFSGQWKYGLQPRIEVAVQRDREGVEEPLRNPGKGTVVGRRRVV